MINPNSASIQKRKKTRESETIRKLALLYESCGTNPQDRNNTYKVTRWDNSTIMSALHRQRGVQA